MVFSGEGNQELSESSIKLPEKHLQAACCGLTAGPSHVLMGAGGIGL